MKLLIGIVSLLVLIGFCIGVGLFFNKKKLEDITPRQMRVIRILIAVLAAIGVGFRLKSMLGY